MPVTRRHFVRFAATVVAVVFALFLRPVTAGAHEGPPYPILMGKNIPGYEVSVYADPDVGTGSFYIMLEPTAPGGESTPPWVSVWVEPADGRLERVTYPAGRQRELDRLQYFAEPHFDRVGAWTIGFVFHRSRGEDVSFEQSVSRLVTEVEVTPPGYGAWSLLIYLFPFLLFGGMWALALLRRWRSTSQGDIDQSMKDASSQSAQEDDHQIREP